MVLRRYEVKNFVRSIIGLSFFLTCVGVLCSEIMKTPYSLILIVFAEVILSVFLAIGLMYVGEQGRKERTCVYLVIVFAIFTLLELRIVMNIPDAGSSSGQDTSLISLHSEGSSPSPANAISLFDNEH